MAMRECPECGSSVKLENMKRHYANVHPGKDPGHAISEEEHREIRRAARPGGSSVTTQRVLIVVAAVLVIVAAAAYFGLPVLLGGHGGPNFNIETYCGVEGSVEHYHPLLVINVNGAQKEVPPDIGISASETNPSFPCNGGLHVLHTHDGSGIIHAELPAVPATAPTLGDFFAIWGQPITPTGVWTYSGTVTTAMYDSDTHVTTDYSASPWTLPLYPSPQGPTANPYPIPQSLIWNGANGNGQSSGYYSGEIIWVNVTA